MSLSRTIFAPSSHAARTSALSSRGVATQTRPGSKTQDVQQDANLSGINTPRTTETPMGKPTLGKAKAPSAPTLNWPEYLAIRRSKRRWETAATIPSGFLGFSSGISYFGSLETDPMKPIFGFDPFLAYGFLTVGCLGLGVLAGPTIGGALWRFTHRHQVQLIDEKDREFHHRIAKNRVDASLQSPTAPVPDYYGEKIGSMHQYRHWLRDQGKYKRKALLPEKED